MSSTRLADIVGTLHAAKILVLGDPINDVYHFGRVERISQEAPVPIFVQDEYEERNGGALNVGANLHALGARCRMVLPDKPYTNKHRYLVGHQQIFRRDQDVQHPPFSMDADLEDCLDWCNSVILSDYGKGCLSHAFCQEVIDATRKRWKHVLVDPRGGDWNKYSGATVIFPNQEEIRAHAAIRTGAQPVFPFVVEKMGAHGIRLVIDGKPFRTYPAKARQVFDVTGAGDTVIATFAAATWHMGHSINDAVVLANLAAGLVVGKVGTATVTQQELLNALELLNAVENDDGPRSETDTEGEASAAGEAREFGREHRPENLEAERDRDPVPAPRGGDAPGGEVSAGG